MHLVFISLCVVLLGVCAWLALQVFREDGGWRSMAVALSAIGGIAGLVQSGLPTRLVKEVLELEDAAADERPSCPRTVADMLARELTGIEERIACLSRSRDTIRDYLTRTEHAALVSEREAVSV